MAFVLHAVPDSVGSWSVLELQPHASVVTGRLANCITARAQSSAHLYRVQLQLGVYFPLAWFLAVQLSLAFVLASEEAR